MRKKYYAPKIMIGEIECEEFIANSQPDSEKPDWQIEIATKEEDKELGWDDLDI